MSINSPIVVFGGGISGLLYAYHNLLKGVPVSLYEGQSIGNGASSARSGILVPPQGKESFVKGLSALEQLINELRGKGYDIPFKRLPQLRLLENKLRRKLRADEELITLGELKVLEPSLLLAQRKYIGAIRSSLGAYVNTSALLTVLSLEIKRLGGEIFFDTLLELKVTDKGHYLTLASGGKLKVPEVALALGAGILPFSEDLGMEVILDGGEILGVSYDSTLKHLLHWNRLSFVKRDNESTLWITGIHRLGEIVPSFCDNALKELLSATKDLFGDCGETVERWSGIRVRFPAREVLPYLNSLGVKILGGFGGNGFLGAAQIL
jgi:glycine/D-amino acid oxidase-like deaminating enzyme